jgi:drug/metabolite transporter (DMT)-like permease
LAVNIAAVIFGSCALFGKLDVSPTWIVTGRAGFAAVTLFLLAVIRRAPFRVDAVDLAKSGGTGALLALHWVTFFMSVQDAGVAVATLTFATFPLFTVLLESAVSRRWPNIVEVGGGLVIVFAVSLLVGQGLPVGEVAQHGAVVGLASAVFFAAFSVLSQRLGDKVNAITLSLYQNVAVVLLLVFALPFADRVPKVADWPIIAALGVIATALMHQLYFFSLKRLPAAVCGAFVALEPVYAIIFAAILFSEPLTGIVVLSGALIVGASLLLLFRARLSTPAI